MCVTVHSTVHKWKSENNCEIHFSPSFVQISGMELRVSGLMADAFAHWAILQAFADIVFKQDLAIQQSRLVSNTNSSGLSLLGPLNARITGVHHHT